MKLWVVYADDHDYDRMNQWLVGVYSNEGLAILAENQEYIRYWKEHPGSREQNIPTISIYETELDS